MFHVKHSAEVQHKIDTLRLRAEEFRRDVVERQAAGWERDRRQPVEALRAAAAAGLGGIEVPEAMGGLGLPFSAKRIVAEELARGDMAFAFSFINTQNIARKLAADGSAGHKAFVAPLITGEIVGATALTEPSAGSDFSAIRMSAKPVQEGWRLDGEKAWITNAAIADLFIVYAQTNPDLGWRGIACFLIDARKPGFERRPAFDLAGGHAIGAGGFVLDGYVAAAEDRLHGPGEAFKQAMTSINGARTYVAAMCCGMVRDALGKALRYGEQRATFGRKLPEHQGWRWTLSTVATELEAARALVDRAAACLDRGEDAVLAAAQAKSFAPAMALRAIESCMQAMGANGLREEHGLGRHLMLARIASYVDGSTEMQKERISAALLAAYGAE